MEGTEELAATIEAVLRRDQEQSVLEALLERLFAQRGLTLPLVVAIGPASWSARKAIVQCVAPLLGHARIVGAEPAAQEQVRLLTENRLTVERASAFWGLNPTAAIQLTPDLRLLPLELTPPSQARSFFLPEEHPPEGRHHPKPRAAFLYRYLIEPVYWRPNTGGLAFTYDDKFLMGDLVNVASLLARGPTIRAAEWTLYPASAAILPTSSGWSGGLTDTRIVHELPKNEVDAAAASHLFTRYFALSLLERRRLQVALRRINQSWSKDTISDQAIDLGIALEALLSGESDPTDGITHRLRVRVARLLGGVAGERDRLASTISTFYGLRSKAAHGGDIDRPLSMEESIKLGGKRISGSELTAMVSDARAICIRLVEHILTRGSFPDFKRVDLGEDD